MDDRRRYGNEYEEYGRFEEESRGGYRGPGFSEERDREPGRRSRGGPSSSFQGSSNDRGRGFAYGQGEYGRDGYGQGGFRRSTDGRDEWEESRGRMSTRSGSEGVSGSDRGRGEEGAWRPGEDPSYGEVGSSSRSGGSYQDRGGRGGSRAWGVQSEESRGGRYQGGSFQGRGQYGGDSGQSYGSGRGGYGYGSDEQADFDRQRYSGSYGFGSSGRERGGSLQSSGIGRYAGRGPKGYTRSDERIKEQVSEKLEENGEVDASEITVQVKDGEVTLEGTVIDRWMKRRAEDVAEECPGVKQVQNRLRVEGGDGSDSRASKESVLGSSTGAGSPKSSTSRRGI
jgi:osmotically-inducible protein OsmY